MHSTLQGELGTDKSTGKTPRKRVIVIPNSWELTKPHQELIEELRGDENGGRGENENENLVASTPSKLPQRKRRVLAEVDE